MQEEYKFFKIAHKEWKNPIKYEISNYGNIKRNGIIIHPNTNIKGYINVCSEYLHRVVAELFIPNPENKPEVDHIDGNKFNNHYTNLRWVTHEENLNNPISRKRNSESKIQQYKDIPELKEKVGPKRGNHYSKMAEAALNRPPMKEETKQKISKNNGKGMLGKNLKDYMTEESYNQWLQKQQNKGPLKEETKQKLSLKFSGENNPMFGKDLRRWVNKDGIRHLIKKDELNNYINSGWKLGQKITN